MQMPKQSNHTVVEDMLCLTAVKSEWGLRTALDQGCTFWWKKSPVPTKMFHIPSKLSPIRSLLTAFAKTLYVPVVFGMFWS